MQDKPNVPGDDLGKKKGTDYPETGKQGGQGDIGKKGGGLGESGKPHEPRKPGDVPQQ